MRPSIDGDFGPPNEVAIRLEGLATNLTGSSPLLREAARMLRTIAGTVAIDPKNAARARRYRDKRRATKRDASATLDVTVRGATRDLGDFEGVSFGSDKQAFGDQKSLNTKAENDTNTKTNNPSLQAEIRADSVRVASRTDAHAETLLIPVSQIVQVATKRVRSTPSPLCRQAWDAWPKHHRKTDLAAFVRSWAAKGCEEIGDEVIASIQAWRVSEEWSKDSGKFIPAPDVWLNKSRWIGKPTSNSRRPDFTADQALDGIRENPL